jgi:uncharacterized protein (TIGR02284 family)
MAADDRDMNRDPITDEPGAHPVGTGVGATGGALAGAAAGTIAGPVGTMVGGVIGAVVGGLAGKAAAEAVNPTAEEAHWRDNYTREPYYEQGRTFDDYQPAYMHGMNARMQHDTDWEAAEPRLASEWENQRAGSGLSWEQARPASRAAWDRVEARRSGSGAMGSDTAMVRAADLAPVARSGGTDMAGSSIGMDQDVGGHSSDRGMGTTGMENPAGIAGRPGGSGMAGSPISTPRDTSIPGFAGTVQSGSNTGGTDQAGRDAMGGGAVTSPQPSTMPGSQSQSQGRSQSQSQSQGGSGQNTGVAGMVGSAQSAGNSDGDRDDIVDALQDLVECCKDGEYGFRESAEQAKRPDLKAVFLQRADDCRRGAEELNEQIRRLGGSVKDSGSALGALHRGWVSVKTTLSTYDDKAVLEECERGEDNALARYRKAMKQQLPEHVKAVVERQSQAVQRNHDQIKMLRDSTQRT